MINNLPFAIIAAIVTFLLFRVSFARVKTAASRGLLIAAASVMITPALLFLSNYLLHIPSRPWFYSFHSLPMIEASSGLVGAFLGVVFASSRFHRRYMKLTISTTAALLLLIVPFSKQLFFNLDYAQLQDRWNHGICQQSCGTTCVPASCANAIHALGGRISERELARDAGTTTRGTEMWYMIRAIQKHGYMIEVCTAKSIKDMKTPCIAGMSQAGHVVAVMSETNDGVLVVNSLEGKLRHYTWSDFKERYHPEPVYFAIKPLRMKR